jgi:aminoglycoside/choline kinase family phosphotransferase
MQAQPTPPDRREIAEACARLLRQKIFDVARTAKGRRRSFRVQLADRTVIATHRESADRGRLEAFALGELHRYGAPVPAMVAFGDGWLVQEDLGEWRLSGTLAQTDSRERREWMERGLDSLGAVHEAARRAELADKVPPLGQTAAWRAGLIAMPGRIAKRLGEALPALDGAALDRAIAADAREFVKWDARPGNAIVKGDGAIGWIDWEHCGARAALDDLAWFLGDEYVDLAAEDEAALLEKYLPRFAPGRAPADAIRALASFGVFHSSVRLALILHHKSDGAWWDLTMCLADDKVGVHKDCALAVARRAARWAEMGGQATAPLGPWFARVGDRLAAL